MIVDMSLTRRPGDNGRNPHTVARNILHTMNTRNIQITELAAITGIPETTLDDWIGNQKNIPLASIERIAHALHTTARKLSTPRAGNSRE